MTRQHEDWGPGPWDDEPDGYCEAFDGLWAVVARAGWGAFVGYVGVPPNHPWHGLQMGDPALEDIDVHGGVTYAMPGLFHDEPEEGLWWIGFDCAHVTDFVPEMVRVMTLVSRERKLPSIFTDSTYRTYEFARDETLRLVRQAQEAVSG